MFRGIGDQTRGAPMLKWFFATTVRLKCTWGLWCCLVTWSCMVILDCIDCESRLGSMLCKPSNTNLPISKVYRSSNFKIPPFWNRGSVCELYEIYSVCLSRIRVMTFHIIKCSLGVVVLSTILHYLDMDVDENTQVPASFSHSHIHVVTKYPLVQIIHNSLNDIIMSIMFLKWAKGVIIWCFIATGRTNYM